MSNARMVAIALTVLLGAACASDEVADAPCDEVRASLEEHERVRAETFGGGADGREAVRTIVETIEQRSDCFGEDDVAQARALSEVLPSERIGEAMDEAEARCDGDVGTSWGGPVDGHPAGAASPEAALDAEYNLPAGEPDRTVETDGEVHLEFHEDGAFRGLAVVEEGDTGWVVSAVVSCHEPGGPTEDPAY